MLNSSPSFPPASRRWRVHPLITSQASQALAAYPPILSQILFNRGLSTDHEAHIFLEHLSPPGTSPWNMVGIEPAVERILSALGRSEPIAIYGDYDVDGVTATALLFLSLRAMGADVRGYIPNRFDEVMDSTRRPWTC